MFPVELRGDGVTLRLLAASDAAPMFAYVSLPEVYEQTSADPWTLAAVESFIVASRVGAGAGAWCRYGIALDGSSGLAGDIGLSVTDAIHRRGEIGYHLSPACWGKGVMGRAVTPILRWAFGEGNFNRIEANVMEGNARSTRVLEKLGFRPEGVMRQFKIVRGTPRDFTMWSLLRVEWQSR